MDVTFLTKEQIWGDDQGNGQLQVMKSYGKAAEASDLAKVLGGYVSSARTQDGIQPGYVWSASSGYVGAVITVYSPKENDHCAAYERFSVARPVLPLSVTSKIMQSEVKLSNKIGDIQVVEYGEYPQTLAPKNVAKDLENAFSNGQLKTTGKSYTFDREEYNAYKKPFNAEEHFEYQHNDKRYIRVKAKPLDKLSMLSTGELVEANKAYWLKVQPIDWLKDPSGVLIAKNGLFSGVQFDMTSNYTGDFKSTFMKKYLDTYFAKEMMIGRNIDSPANIIETKKAVLSEARAAQYNRALNDSTQGL